MENWELKQKQSLPLEQKVALSKQRIREWYDHWKGDVYIAFSGGKDSTVLLDMVRDIDETIPAVFCDTGLEYPEIREFVKSVDNVEWLKPEMNFKRVIEKYGYPVISKEQSKYIHEWRNAKEDSKIKDVRWNGKNGGFKISEKWKKLAMSDIPVSHLCCKIMKKKPFRKYEKSTGRKPYIGLLAQDSNQRMTQYLNKGCNTFDTKNPSSKPMGFWLENNIWEYIKSHEMRYCSIYDKGWDRTGCMFCMFGVHLEPEPNRFQRMKQTHPKLWDYCIHQCGVGKVLDYVGVNYGNTDLRDFM